jgi:hypothetical protein
LALLIAPRALAQESPRPVVWDVARQVILDPTTYVPAVVVYEAKSADWKSSQVLFANGWVEANARFTISGRANDLPVPYGIGRDRIRGDALNILAASVTNNIGAGIAERVLLARYPSRRKLIRALSWGERIAYACYITYRHSAVHWRQSRTNRRLAIEHGLATP